jgi:hypothetical protein
MTIKGSLSFVLNFKTLELSSLDLPVEVRKPNMVLVTRSLTSKSVEVDPGQYFVTATLPAGQELSQMVEVSEGAHSSVELTPEECDKSPRESHEFIHFFLRNQEAVKPPVALSLGMREGEKGAGLESLGGSAVEGRLRLFSGNALREQLQPENQLFPVYPPTVDGLTQITIYGIGAPLTAQLLQPNAPPLNLAVPASANSSCTLVLTLLADSTHSLEVQLEHKVADLLVRYREQGRFSQAVVAIDSPAMDAKSLLKQKKRDPVAAAVGAYSILRFGRLDQLHDWTKNLWQLFPWLPDGVAIRGEHLARVGKHDEALDVFLGLPEHGLPFFSEGLSYAANRLRFYESLGAKEFGADRVRRATEVLALLQRFIPYVDFGKPVLTYTGLNPARPDDEPLDDFVPAADGLDLASLV